MKHVPISEAQQLRSLEGRHLGYNTQNPRSVLRQHLGEAKELTAGISVTLCDFWEFYEFSLKYFEQFFPNVSAKNLGLYKKDMQALREEYYRECAECLRLVNKDHQTIGVFAGSFMDWQQYYLRAVTINPDYNGRGIYQKLLAYYLESLGKSGYRNALADVGSSNFGKVHIYNKFRFQVIGVYFDPDWGNVIRFSKNLQRKEADMRKKFALLTL